MHHPLYTLYEYFPVVVIHKAGSPAIEAEALETQSYRGVTLDKYDPYPVVCKRLQFNIQKLCSMPLASLF